MVPKIEIFLTLFVALALRDGGPDLGTLNPDLLGVVMSFLSNRRSVSFLRAPVTSLFAAVFALVGAYSLVDSAAATDEMVVEITIKDHKFEPSALKLPAAKHIKLSVKNLDASAEEFESKDLGIEKVIAGNSDATIRVKPLAAGTYIFYGEYHEDTAKGQIVVE
jgi:plastocyanin